MLADRSTAPLTTSLTSSSPSPTPTDADVAAFSLAPTLPPRYRLRFLRASDRPPAFP